MISKIEGKKVHLIFDVGEYNSDVIDFITLLGISSNSQATDEDIEELAEELKADWWAKNKGSFLGESGH